MEEQTSSRFGNLKQRLDDILEMVSDPDIALDDALDLYEEAVGLGLQASSILEQDMTEDEQKEAEASLGESEGNASAEEPSEAGEAE